jgi:hypothetical protein
VSRAVATAVADEAERDGIAGGDAQLSRIG